MKTVSVKVEAVGSLQFIYIDDVKTKYTAFEWNVGTLQLTGEGLDPWEGKISIYRCEGVGDTMLKHVYVCEVDDD